MYFFAECEECSNKELRSFAQVFDVLTDQWSRVADKEKSSDWFSVYLTRECDCGHTTTYSSQSHPMVAYLAGLIFELIVGREVHIR